MRNEQPIYARFYGETNEEWNVRIENHIYNISKEIFDDEWEAKSITIILKKHTHKINNKIIINDNPYPFIYGIDTALSDSIEHIKGKLFKVSKIPKKYLDNDLQ